MAYLPAPSDEGFVKGRRVGQFEFRFGSVTLLADVDQFFIRISALRVLVERLHVAVGGSAIEVVVALFDVFAVIAFLGVVFIGTLEGILIAAICSLVTIQYGTSIPNVYEVGRKAGTNIFRPVEDHPQDETYPDLLLLRIEGLLYFANVNYAIDKITTLAREKEPRVIVVDCSAVPIIEYTAMKELQEFDSKLRDAGIELWIADLNRNMFEVIESSTFGQVLQQERMFFNLEQAVETFSERSK